MCCFEFTVIKVCNLGSHNKVTLSALSLLNPGFFDTETKIELKQGSFLRVSTDGLGLELISSEIRTVPSCFVYVATFNLSI